MPSEPSSLTQLLNMPVDQAIAWIIGGGGGLVAGGLGYKLFFGRPTEGESQTREAANETLRGLVSTMSEIRDFLRDFCSHVRADHARQMEVQRAEAEVLQHLTELLVRIDTRLERAGG